MKNPTMHICFGFSTILVTLALLTGCNSKVEKPLSSPTVNYFPESKKPTPILRKFTPPFTLSKEVADDTRIRRQVVNLFQKEDYKQLSQLADEYRIKESRSGIGGWNLNLIYMAIENSFTNRITEKSYWKNLENKALKWQKQYPKSPAGYIVYAKIMTRRAWAARGFGFAKEVKPEDWKPFKEYLEKGRQYLLANKQIASVDPVWYREMISIATYQGWDISDYLALLDEASSRFPYFQGIYLEGVTFFLPKWFGDADAIEYFANWVVRKTENKEGKSFYARIYVYLADFEYGNRLYSETKIDWEKMKQGMDDWLQRYSDSSEDNLNRFLYHSCLKKDKEKAKEYLNKMTKAPLLEIWQTWDVFDQCQVFTLN